MKKRLNNRGIIALEMTVIAVTVSIISAIVIPMISKSRDSAKSTVCMSNQRQIALAIQLYAQDNVSKLPISAKMWSAIKKYSNADNIVKCPEDQNDGNSYIYNNNLSGMKLDKITDESTTMLTVDGKTIKGKNRTLDNIYYSPADVQYRHSSLAVVSYVDGHVATTNTISAKDSWDK